MIHFSPFEFKKWFKNSYTRDLFHQLYPSMAEKNIFYVVTTRTCWTMDGGDFLSVMQILEEPGMRRWLGYIYYERVALNIEWWSWNGDLVIFIYTHFSQKNTFHSQKNAFKMHFYSGWLYPCLVCDSPFTPSHTATTEEERSRQGDNAEGSCVPFSCPLIEESCNYCRLPKLPPVQKRFIFDVKMGSGWLTVIPVSLPPRTPGAKAR